MREELLHHIWKFKKFDHNKLLSTHGDTISIINYGQHNHNSGPDFLNARIYINNTLWVGHVEIHVLASEWKSHNHQEDPAYNNVILHVVFEDNKKVFNHNGLLLTTIELKDRVDPAILNKYEQFFNYQNTIPCQSVIASFPDSRMPMYLEYLLIRRLERKSLHIKKCLDKYRHDWEALTYHLLFVYLGGPTNKESFENLYSRVQLNQLARMNTISDVEAMLFGQAGLLGEDGDEYESSLQRKYTHFQNKYNLFPMGKSEWRFHRMRPSNFPTIRLAQLSMLLFSYPKIFSHILNAENVEMLFQILSLSASDYWSYHYNFGKPTPFLEKRIGKNTQMSILINAFIPLLFTYASINSNLKLQDLCLEFYSKLPSEKNKIIRQWQNIHINSYNSGESQALIELKTQFCERFNCLNCQIGTKLLLE